MAQEEEYRALADKIMGNVNGFGCEDKESIMCWLVRLNQKARDTEESSRIVEYARYLYHMTSKGMLHYPFTGCPPCKKLPPLDNYFKKCRPRSPCPAAECDWPSAKTPSELGMTVGDLVDSMFEKKGSVCPKDEVIGRIFEEMFDSTELPCTPKPKRKVWPPPEHVNLPMLNEVVNMNVECLQNQLVQELQDVNDQNLNRVQALAGILVHRVNESIGDCPPSPCPSQRPDTMSPEQLVEEYLGAKEKCGSRYEEISFHLQELFDSAACPTDASASCPQTFDYAADSDMSVTCPQTFEYSSSCPPSPQSFEYSSSCPFSNRSAEPETSQGVVEYYSGELEEDYEEEAEEECNEEDEAYRYVPVPILQRPGQYYVPKPNVMSPLAEDSAESAYRAMSPTSRDWYQMDSSEFSSDYMSSGGGFSPPCPAANTSGQLQDMSYGQVFSGSFQGGVSFGDEEFFGDAAAVLGNIPSPADDQCI